ncbi:oligosaccharide flippase family protein [Vibrio sp. MarTm2]|uniref:oligosaccharide flippase family protein n=1 Tax=Vibrio sp. MarTm2 TaxID=2998831 RepID=UPI0022CD718C|nr:oligosaccharide flippase family protein [Vibrio sp. MarTm2]MDA0129875.1 oligosaccharide flippase family protein [Vibrio sp. MarTm2]
MRIVKDSIIYVLGEVVVKLIPFLMLPYLTRELGPQSFGELANILAYVAMISIFIGLSQEGALARYYYRYGFRAINVVYLSCVIYSTLAALFLYLSSFLLDLNSEIALYVILMSFSQSLLTSQLSLKQVQKKVKDYVLIQLICALTAVILTVLFFENFGATHEMRLLGIVVSNAFSLAFGTYLNSHVFCSSSYLKIGVIKKTNRYIICYGIPLLVHKISFFVKGNVDKIIIFSYFSAKELGVYSAAYQLSSVVMIVLASTNRALVPYYYSSLKSKKISRDEVRKWAIRSYIFVIFSATPFFFIPDWIFASLLGDGFSGVGRYVSLFTLGFLLQIPYYLAVNYFFYYAENFKLSSVTFFSSLIYMISLLYLSEISIDYVPYALVISNLFSSVLLILLLNGNSNEVDN